ncbi:MAG: nucleoside phosphorylase-I family protein, partial [Bacillota bacterium]
ELGAEKIIGLGHGDQISPSLRPGDMIISGEVWEDGGGNNRPVVYPADPKLVDLFLAAAERVDEGEELRALVGRLVDAVNAAQEENQSTTVYYTDPLATSMAKWSSFNGVPFVILHVIITSGEIEDEEFHRNGAKRLFWLLKGVLEELKNPPKEI